MGVEALGPIGAGVQLGGNILSLIGSAKANKQRQKALNQRRADIQNWFDKDYNQDFLTNQESTSAIRNLSNKLKETQTNQSNTNAIMGGTDESALAQKDQNVRTYADFINNLASKATSVKQRAKDNYFNQMNGIYSAQEALDREKGNGWLNFGKLTNDTGGAIMQLGGMAAPKKASTTTPGSASDFGSPQYTGAGPAGVPLDTSGPTGSLKPLYNK